MMPSDEIQQSLYTRLRRPASPSTVHGSLPVLFFGDLITAHIATVGLNPSTSEYLGKQGEELDGPKRRFETLTSLEAAARSELTDDQCRRTIDTMRGYFDLGKPSYSWFASLSRVTQGLGSQYGGREVAHLDLVQEATDHKWSQLNQAHPAEARTLLGTDLDFLKWEIQTFPLKVIVCNGRTPLDHVINLTQAEVISVEPMARIKMTVALSTTSSTPQAIVGWNLPLAQPTGLTSSAQFEMGDYFRERVRRLGIDLGTGSTP